MERIKKPAIAWILCGLVHLTVGCGTTKVVKTEDDSRFVQKTKESSQEQAPMTAGKGSRFAAPGMYWVPILGEILMVVDVVNVIKNTKSDHPDQAK